MPSCPTFVGASRATQIVDAGWTKWNTFATTMVNQTLTYLQDLEELEFATHDEDIIVQSPTLTGRTYTPPTRPTTEELELDTSGEPSAPDYSNITLDGFLAAPTFNQTAPTLDFGGAPEKPISGLPGAPTVTDPTIPADPSVTLPDVPTLRELTLPEVPTLDVLTFDRTAPSMTGLVVPDAAFDFTDEDFTDQLLTDTKALITAGLTGINGLPSPVWNRIWDLARAKIVQANRAQLKAAQIEWSRRGFTMPGEQAVAAMKQARLQNQIQMSDAAFKQAVDSSQKEIDLLKDYSQQGIALVSFLGQMHNDQMQRAFAAAQYTFEASIRIFEARVELYKADLQGYVAEAEVFKARLQANLTRLESFKAQIEGQRVIGELNKQDVDIYRAQLDGQLASVEVYKAQIEAVQAKVAVDSAKIDAYRGLVAAFGERVRAYSAEVQGYVAGIQGETAKMEGYGVAARAYAAEVSAYAAGNTAIAQQKQIEIEQQKLLAQQYGQQLSAWSAKIDADSRRVSAILESYEADARIYQTDGAIEEQRVRTVLEEYNVNVRKALGEADLKLKQADQRISQIQRINGLELDRGRTIATAYGQLTSSAMSAVNLSANIGDNIAENYGCTTSHNYSY